MRDALTLDLPAAFEPAQMMQRLFEARRARWSGVSPLFLLVAVVALLAPMLVSGWLFTFEGLRPDFSRLTHCAGSGASCPCAGRSKWAKPCSRSCWWGARPSGSVWSARAELFSLFGQALEPALSHLGTCWAAPS